MCLEGPLERAHLIRLPIDIVEEPLPTIHLLDMQLAARYLRYIVLAASQRSGRENERLVDRRCPPLQLGCN